MRNVAFTSVALASLLLITGCGKSGKSYYMSTVAPTTSTTPSTPTTSTTTPVTSTLPPPVQTLHTDALVSSWDLQEVIEVDAQAGTITNRWATGEGPIDVVNGTTESFVACAVDQEITVIDRLAGTVGTPIDLADPNHSPTNLASIPLVGSALAGWIDPYFRQAVRPTGLALTPNGSKLISANLANVTIIDATNHTLSKSFVGLEMPSTTAISNAYNNAGGGAAGVWAGVQAFYQQTVRGLGMARVAATNDQALVTCMISGTVMRIDLTTERVIGYTDVGRAPIGIALAGNKAYVACALDQEINIVDITNGNVIGTLAAGMIPVDVAVNPAGDRVYVANAVSGDITVIDTAADLVIDTLPAGMALTSIFQQLGVTLPANTTGGWSGFLNGFLSGFTTGMSNPNNFGSLLFPQNGSSGLSNLLSPGSLINGVLTGFLGAAGVSSSQLSGMNMPAFGIMSISVTHNPDYVCTGNAFMGELGVTEITTRNVTPISGLTGLGPVDVAAIWSH